MIAVTDRSMKKDNVGTLVLHSGMTIGDCDQIFVCSAPHRHPVADAAATTDHFRARNGLITWVEPY